MRIGVSAGGKDIANKVVTKNIREQLTTGGKGKNLSEHG